MEVPAFFIAMAITFGVCFNYFGNTPADFEQATKACEAINSKPKILRIDGDVDCENGVEIVWNSGKYPTEKEK